MFSEEQIERYSRHMILKEVGGKGQKKLLNSRVLIIGVGGLGSPVALYLAAAGIGTIGIADADSVEISNLQRQVIHHTTDVGKAKVLSARDKMMAINPDIKVVPYQTWIEADNILDIIANYDFIIDGTDSFASKFLINDACVLAGKPFSHCGVLGFSGQTITVLPRESACCRCIFHEPPPPDSTPSCSQAGVIGVLPGLFGTIQAMEAVKYLLGKGELLTDRLLFLDALEMRFQELKLERRKDCAVCGDAPSITQVRDQLEAMTLCDLGKV